MALTDFVQSLTQNDTIYSTLPEPSIKVYSPKDPVQREEKPQVVKIESVPKDIQKLNKELPNAPAPMVIKLKLDQHVEQADNNQPAPIVHSLPEENRTEIKQTVQTVQPESIQPKIEVPKVETPKIEPKEEPIKEEPQNVRLDDDESLFNYTGTECSKKSIWMKYFKEAKNSRKNNVIVERMKAGRFTITPDNKVLLLPDYDVVNKDPDDILKDKWF